MDDKTKKIVNRLKTKRKFLIEKILNLPLKSKFRKLNIIYTQEEKEIRLKLFKIKYGLIGSRDTEDNFKELIEKKGFVEYKSCTNKIAYFNAASLKKAVNEVSLRTGHKHYGYYCEFCDAFHSTSHPCAHLENINFGEGEFKNGA